MYLFIPTRYFHCYKRCIVDFNHRAIAHVRHTKKNGRFQLKTTIFNIEKDNSLEIVIEAESNVERLFERCRRQSKIIHQ